MTSQLVQSERNAGTVITTVPDGDKSDTTCDNASAGRSRCSSTSSITIRSYGAAGWNVESNGRMEIAPPRSSVTRSDDGSTPSTTEPNSVNLEKNRPSPQPMS